MLPASLLPLNVQQTQQNAKYLFQRQFQLQQPEASLNKMQIELFNIPLMIHHKHSKLQDR